MASYYICIISLILYREIVNKYRCIVFYYILSGNRSMLLQLFSYPSTQHEIWIFPIRCTFSLLNRNTVVFYFTICVAANWTEHGCDACTPIIQAFQTILNRILSFDFHSYFTFSWNFLLMANMNNAIKTWEMTIPRKTSHINKKKILN